ncbi:MAG: M15 family peptidase [Spirochaetaceae bacterium]|nr:MAG: M15 family peptidase [Spirochaetaceae bacterium]
MRLSAVVATAVAALLMAATVSAESTAGAFRLPGAIEIHAVATAYPERVRATAVIDGDWALLIDSTWYFWADGRMLPESERDAADSYARYNFSPYTPGPPRLRTVEPDQAERLRRYTSAIEFLQPPRHPGFTNALYRIENRADTFREILPVSFLGMRTNVHRMITDPLSRVEREITDAMQAEPEVRAFVRSLRQASGFVWRNISGSQTMSYHAYGIAVDLLPAGYSNRFAYWRWARAAGIVEWWEVPFERRWSVPQPVIDAFERNGFVWGGKWLRFDAIHFEYRPEILLLSRWLGFDPDRTVEFEQ